MLKHALTRLVCVPLLFAALVLSAQEETGAYDDEYEDFGEEEGVTVTASPDPDTTQQMKVITRDDIEKRNARDLSTLLEEELDMSVTRTGAYGN
jgi:outer membrane cobalamin receptor